MKSLFTRCPSCGAHFYKNISKDEKVSNMNIVCPYCNYTYIDSLDEDRVKEHDFYWEIYSGLYPSLKIEKHKKTRLIVAGILLFLTIPFFVYGFSQIFISNSLSSLSGSEINSIYGVWLAGIIFLLFVVSGIISAIKRYSFVISLSGVIFALLSSVLWFYMYQSLEINMLGDLSQLLMFVPQILSILSLVLIIRYRKSFKLGY